MGVTLLIGLYTVGCLERVCGPGLCSLLYLFFCVTAENKFISITLYKYQTVGRGTSTYGLEDECTGLLASFILLQSQSLYFYMWVSDFSEPATRPTK